MDVISDFNQHTQHPPADETANAIWQIYMKKKKSHFVKEDFPLKTPHEAHVGADSGIDLLQLCGYRYINEPRKDA